jgi:3'-phosphoadenosine 5'-phosphosulfate (PAPS) 3'-phosphatase
MDNLIGACHPVNVARVAGSGNKIIHMLDSKADYYINLVPGFKYWDMCASEALI